MTQLRKLHIVSPVRIPHTREANNEIAEVQEAVRNCWKAVGADMLAVLEKVKEKHGHKNTKEKV